MADLKWAKRVGKGIKKGVGAVGGTAKKAVGWTAPARNAKAEKVIARKQAGNMTKAQTKKYTKAETQAKNSQAYKDAQQQEAKELRRISAAERSKLQKIQTQKSKELSSSRPKVYTAKSRHVQDVTKRMNDSINAKNAAARQANPNAAQTANVTAKEIADRMNRKGSARFKKESNKINAKYSNIQKRYTDMIKKKTESVQGSADRMLADLTKGNLAKIYGKSLRNKILGYGALGAGLIVPSLLRAGQDEEQQQQEEPDPYMVGDDGQMDYYDGSQYQDLPNGFMTDRDGSTLLHVNGQFYRPDQFIQHADGTVTDQQGNLLFQQDIDTGDASIFDYYGQQALGANYSPEQVKAIQEQLGVTADGLWGQETQRAFNLYKTLANASPEEQQKMLEDMQKGSYFSQYTTPQGDINISQQSRPSNKTISPIDQVSQIAQNSFQNAIDPNYYMSLVQQAQQQGATPAVGANPALMRRGGRLIPRLQAGGKLKKKVQSAAVNTLKKSLPGDLQQLRTDRNLAMRLQKQMAAKGMYNGPIDGKFGVGSLAAYQKMAKAGYHRGMGQDWSNTPAVRKKAQPKPRGVLGAVQAIIQKGLNMTPEQQKKYLAAQKQKSKDLSWSDVLTGDNTDASGDSELGGRLVQKIFHTDKDSGWNLLGDMASMFVPAANAVNAINDFRHGDFWGGMLNTFYSLPLIGTGAKAIGNLIKGGTKIAKATSKAAKVGNVVSRTANVTRTAPAAQGATKVTNNFRRARKLVNAPKKLNNIGVKIQNSRPVKLANTAMNGYFLYGLGSMANNTWNDSKQKAGQYQGVRNFINYQKDQGLNDAQIREAAMNEFTDDTNREEFMKQYDDIVNGGTTWLENLGYTYNE